MAGLSLATGAIVGEDAGLAEPVEATGEDTYPASLARNQLAAVESDLKNSNSISATLAAPLGEGCVQSKAMSSAVHTRPSARGLSPSIHR